MITYYDDYDTKSLLKTSNSNSKTAYNALAEVMADAETNGNVTLLKLSIASVISIISDVLKRVKGIWVVYVMSVCRRHRRQFDITIVFVLTVL